PETTSYPVIVTPAPGCSRMAISLPDSIAIGPLLVTVTVNVVDWPAVTNDWSATFSMLSAYGRSTGISGVSSSSSSSSVPGSFSGPHTAMPFEIVEPAAAVTFAVISNVMDSPAGSASVVVSRRLSPLPLIVALPDVTSYPVTTNPALGRSSTEMTLPAAMVAGPLLVTVTVNDVVPPAITVWSFADFDTLNTDS